jgi:hypothetical protein
MYPPLSGKPRTRAKRPLYTNRVILPNELFAPNVIRTLDFIGMSPRPKPLPLEPTPWG